MTSIEGFLDVRRQGVNKLCTLSPIILTTQAAGRVIVPRGFVFDGGSIPEALTSIAGCPFNTSADYGYLCHDRLYYLSRVNGSPGVTREQADNAMLELHLHCGVDYVRAHGIFTVVRGYSWRYWGAGKPDLPEHTLEDWFLDQ